MCKFVGIKKLEKQVKSSFIKYILILYDTRLLSLLKICHLTLTIFKFNSFKISLVSKSLVGTSSQLVRVELDRFQVIRSEHE